MAAFVSSADKRKTYCLYEAESGEMPYVKPHGAPVFFPADIVKITGGGAAVRKTVACVLKL